MKHVMLVAREQDGILGLMTEDMKVIDYPMIATEGLLIAHDIIEHQNGLKSIGSIDDELEALGAIWHTRGRWGELRRNSMNAYSVEENIASDIVNLGEIYIQGVNFRNEIPRTRERDEDVAFKKMLELARPQIMDYVENEYTFIGDSCPGDRAKEYLDAVIHWLRTGYMKANKRFGTGLSSYEMFWHIAEEVDKYVKSIDYEGQKFRLSYDRYSAKVEEIYYDDYY